MKSFYEYIIEVRSASDLIAAGHSREFAAQRDNRLRSIAHDMEQHWSPNIIAGAIQQNDKSRLDEPKETYGDTIDAEPRLRPLGKSRLSSVQSSLSNYLRGLRILHKNAPTEFDPTTGKVVRPPSSAQIRKDQEWARNSDGTSISMPNREMHIKESEEDHVHYHLHTKPVGKEKPKYIGSVSAVTEFEAHKKFLKLLKDSRENGNIDGYNYTQTKSNKPI